jgi:hypothetical protein
MPTIPAFLGGDEAGAATNATCTPPKGYVDKGRRAPNGQIMYENVDHPGQHVMCLPPDAVAALERAREGATRVRVRYAHGARQGGPSPGVP